MIRLEQHVPSFVERSTPPRTAEVRTMPDVFAVNWISVWAEQGGFHRWVMSEDARVLLAEWDGGRHVFVVALALQKDGEPFTGLPVWIPPSRRRKGP